MLIIVGALWILPEKHQSVSWTLTGFHNETGWTWLPYVFLMGLLMAQYTYTGYDASAHVAEETRDASGAAPQGHRDERAGLGDRRLHPALLDHRVDHRQLRGGPDRAGGQPTTGLPPAQIFLDSLGSPAVAKFLLFIVCVAQFFCGMASVTANSRMSYAFSRDNALPGSRHLVEGQPAHRARRPTRSGSAWACRSCWPRRR